MKNNLSYFHMIFQTFYVVKCCFTLITLMYDFSTCLWSQNLNYKLYIFDHLVHELFSYDFSNFLCSQMLLHIYDIYFHTHLIYDFSTCLWSQNLNHKLYIFDYLVHELLSYGFSNFLCCQMLFHIYDTYFQKH